MTKPNVLIIDDDADYLALLSEALIDDFHTSTATTLSDADALCMAQDFDIALVDECIGDEKGSSWIKTKVEAGSRTKSFVLYSGMANEEAILRGLECGADDFMSKPISLITLIEKLKKLINYQHRIQNFEQQLESKDNVINISMAQASKYGACMQLTSRLNRCFSLEQIRDELFGFFNSMQLNACIGFYPDANQYVHYHSVNGYCSPVEIEVMELLKSKPRLYQFGRRTIFNHPLVSILVLNLEQGALDTDIYIDALASVIECVGARIEFIQYKNSLITVQDQIKQAVTTTKKMVEISKLHQQEIMNEIVQKFGVSFHVLDLSEEQEDYLTKLIHDALKKHSQDDVNFLEVSALLDQALHSVEQLKSLNQQVEEQTPDIFDDDEDVLF